MKQSRRRNRRLKTLFARLALAGAFALSCSGRPKAFSYVAPDIGPGENAAELRALADNWWQRREDPLNARKALAAYQHAFDADRANVALGVRLAEANFFVAEYVFAPGCDPERNLAPRLELYAQGLSAGERALEAHEEFRITHRQTRDEARALARLDTAKIAAIYWTYANMVRWSQEQNWFRRLGNKQRLEIYRHRLLELNDAYHYGGVYRLGRSMEKNGAIDIASRNAYERAIAIAPNYFANRRIYAQEYAVAKKDRELFERELNDVLQTEAQVLPGAFPENKFEQQIAGALLQPECLNRLFRIKKEEEPRRVFKPRY